MKSEKFGQIFLITFVICLVSNYVPALAPSQFLSQTEAQTLDDRKATADKLIKLGHQQLDKSQYREALQSYQSALDIYREIKNRNGEGNSSVGLGKAYINIGQYDKAIVFYQQSLVIFTEIKDRKGEGSALKNLGNASYYLGEYQKAIDYYQKSLAIARQIGDRTDEANSLGNLGNVYDSLGQYQKAIKFHQKSLEIFQQSRDLNGEGSALRNLGNAYNSLGQYLKAIDFYEKALAFAMQIGDRNAEGSTLGNLGSAYNSLGQYQKAIEFYQQSLAIAQQIGDRNGQGAAFNNLGSANNSLGMYQKAIDFYQQSLAIAQQIGDQSGQGTSLNNLGESYRSLGRYQKAVDFYQKSLVIFKQIGDLNGEGISLNNLGSAYNILGQYQKSIDFYQQSLLISKQIGDQSSESSALNNLGNTYYSLGLYKQAIEFYQKSLVISKQIGDLNGEGSTLGNLGITYRILGQSQKAIELYQQALAIFKQIGYREGEGKSLNNLGYLFAIQNQPELAILFYKQSVNVRESIRKDIRTLKKEEQKSYLETVAFSYKRLADLLLKQDRVIEALQVLDLLKVQELEDYLKNIKGNARTSQGVRLLEPERTMIAQRLTISYAQSAERNQLLNKQIQQLPKSDIDSAPDYLRNLSQGTVLIYPLILEDRLEIILFAPNMPAIHRAVPIKRSDLEAITTEFLSDLRDPSSEDFRENSQKLYNLLIKPIEANLKNAQTNTILYAPDGMLRYIPITALHDGKKFLIESYTVNNLIAYILSDFTKKTKVKPRILAGAFGGKQGEVVFGQIALPATLLEAQEIQKILKNSTVLTESKFSRQAIEEQIPNHTILHLATHAAFNVGAPENSFIIFGNGDTIRLNEIPTLKMNNIDLIVLSACQTAVGKLGSGVEILGFGYQVQKAGARSAIASLWEVNDTGTQTLMESFYGELQKDNMPISEALRRSQVSLIGSPKYNHPYYWSAFFVIGNGL